MKKALAGVLVVSLVGLMAVAAMAQVPNVQVYFNGNPDYNSFSDTQAQCNGPGFARDLYVVMNNWNMYVAAVEFSIDYPLALAYSGETAPVGTLVIGSTPSNGGLGGVAVSWTSIPQNGFEPVLAMTVHAYETADCDCNQGPQAIVVRGRAYSDPSGNPHPLGVRWPDYAELTGVGMTSLLCPGAVATEQSTWGGVKALYR